MKFSINPEDRGASAIDAGYEDCQVMPFLRNLIEKSLPFKGNAKLL